MNANTFLYIMNMSIRISAKINICYASKNLEYTCKRIVEGYWVWFSIITNIVTYGWSKITASNFISFEMNIVCCCIMINLRLFVEVHLIVHKWMVWMVRKNVILLDRLFILVDVINVVFYMIIILLRLYQLFRILEICDTADSNTYIYCIDPNKLRLIAHWKNSRSVSYALRKNSKLIMIVTDEKCSFHYNCIWSMIINQEQKKGITGNMTSLKCPRYRLA